jgi:hypothetical protein
VHISNEEAQGQTLRHLCLTCADKEYLDSLRPKPWMNWATLLVTVGGVILFVSLLADKLGLGESEGFGWKQTGLMVLAAVVVQIGAVIQIPTLLLAGLIAGLIGAAADYVGFGNAPDFGVQQMAGTALGSLLVIVGLVVARRSARAEQDAVERQENATARAAPPSSSDSAAAPPGS